jgi:hypothetical protein
MKGSADIVYVIDGDEYAVECKRVHCFDSKVPYVSVEDVANTLDGEHLRDMVITERHVGRSGIVAGKATLISSIIVAPHHGSAKLARARPRRIALPPGARLSALARAVLTRGAYRKHVMVAVSEMQAEYIEEICANNFRKARWVSIRGHVLILLTLFRAALPARVRAFLSS